MIKIQTFYLIKIYWPLMFAKVHLLGLLKKFHKKYSVHFKKHCGCAYRIRTDKANAICEVCKRWQKHSRWE